MAETDTVGFRRRLQVRLSIRGNDAIRGTLTHKPFAFIADAPVVSTFGLQVRPLGEPLAPPLPGRPRCLARATHKSIPRTDR